MFKGKCRVSTQSWAAGGAEEEFPYEGRNESQAYVPQENRFQHYYYSGD